MAETGSDLINDTHTPSAGHWVNAVIWVLIALATTFLGLRVFCKYRRGRGLWWDDWILIASWLILLVSGIISSISVAVVFFEHDQDDQMGGHDVGLLTTITGTLFFIAAIWSKTSFALTLFRIAGPRLKIVLRIMMVSMNGITCVSVVLRWLQCHPIRLVWDSDAQGTCWNRNLILGVTIFAASYSAFADFVLAALPWPIIIKLQMRTSEKIGISVAMSMGVCAGITSIIKCTKFSVLKTDKFAGEQNHMHLSSIGGNCLILKFILSLDDVFELSIWSIAEIATTMMAASIPVLRALVREATGTSGRFGCPITYIRDRSRDVASRIRSNHASLAAPRRPKTMRPCADSASDDKAELNKASTNGQIMKMEEVHVQFTDRGAEDNIDLEFERVPRSYSSWI
ncbi:hypothetical protein M434DRAFT_30330 [Hypoxylon sp. CO27-5]|nr:hypothetical protein M434DRAFT_30330 [Hypoxylon sp. CO27-5]